MWYSAVGSIVTLVLSLLTTPHGAEAQQTGKVWRIGVLSFGSSPPGPLEALRKDSTNSVMLRGGISPSSGALGWQQRRLRASRRTRMAGVDAISLSAPRRRLPSDHSDPHRHSGG
jgi:hypothetical protein